MYIAHDNEAESATNPKNLIQIKEVVKGETGDMSS